MWEWPGYRVLHLVQGRCVCMTCNRPWSTSPYSSSLARSAAQFMDELSMAASRIVQYCTQYFSCKVPASLSLKCSEVCLAAAVYLLQFEKLKPEFHII